MKKLDFSFRNSDSSSLVDAVQKTTFTAPVDIVGKVRLTRFKLSEGAFPMCQIGPSVTVYSSREKELIDIYGKTPTDLFFGFQLSYNWENIGGRLELRGKSRGSSYMLAYDAKPVALPFRDTDPMYDTKTYVQIFWLNEPPKWKKRTDGWILANDPTFLYSIDELYTSSRFEVQSNVPLTVLNVTQVNDTIRFDTQLQTSSNASPKMSTPYLLLSELFLKIIGRPARDGFKMRYDNLPQAFGITENTVFYPCSPDYTYNIQLDTLLRSNAFMPEDVDMDFSTTAVFHMSEDKSMLFPYTAILVMIDEFNNPGERIVVNNPDSSGVVNLSTLSITKLFIVGQTNYEKSDFVYVNDSLQESPLVVRLPQQLNLSIRLYFLMKDNSLIPIKIPPLQNFFAQISVDPL